MKKAAVAAAVVVALGAAYLGATAITGQRVASGYDARLTRIEQQFPFVKVTDRQTEKGLFTSTFSGTLRVGCVPDGKSADGSVAGKPLLIGFRDHVRNGPLPGFSGFGAAVVESQIVLPADAPDALLSYAATLRPQDIRTTIGYGGDYRTSLRLPAGRLALPVGTVTWPEIRASGSGRIDGGTLAAEGIVPELAFRGQATAGGAKGIELKLTNLRWQSTQSGEGSVWLRPGRGSVDIERIEAVAETAGKPVSAQISKVRYSSEISAEQDLLNVRIALGGSATLQPGGASQSIQLDDIEFRESINRLHGPTLQKVVQTSMSDWSTCGGPGTAAAPDALEQSRRMLDMLTQLLPYAPEISVDKLALSYGGQRGELSYAASAPGLTAKDLEDTSALQHLLQEKLVLRAEARLPVAWIEQLGSRVGDPAGAAQRVAQANAMIDLAVGKGMLVRQGEYITGSLQIGGGVTTLNGKPFGR